MDVRYIPEAFSLSSAAEAEGLKPCSPSYARYIPAFSL
jgi:hypothetical protein